jgi:hypothetical protein
MIIIYSIYYVKIKKLKKKIKLKKYINLEEIYLLKKRLQKKKDIIK